MSETIVRSREEDEELQQRTKTIKEDHRVGAHHIASLSYGEGGTKSQKEKLIGDILGTFEQAFDFESNMETEIESDDKFTDLPPGEVAMKLSEERKGKVRAPWANALIVKVFEKNVSYHFLHSKLLGMWKPIGKMDYVDLGQDFFLIKSSTVNVSSVVVWIQLPELPIEYCEPSVLRDIGKAIGPVLRIDTRTATESRGCFARVDHKAEGCPYKAGVPKKICRPEEAGKDQISQGQGLSEEATFGPWNLVAQKKKPNRKIRKESYQLPLSVPMEYGPKKLMDTGPSNVALSMVDVSLGNNAGKQKQKASSFSFRAFTAVVAYCYIAIF
ncbi:hypothetical protein CMV_008158 [Castanea mollissima]|uniref:DUF4283 domain-containing protein n=1 Tax=Castanea mollissima TaxID=60419 RepID=A0A8J4W2A5_9ROSI|nr:hypothetical protein CMV_008158 [Castanea mollissima]